MIVLSLFGGMECGRITLSKMGITPTKYYSAEIDKFARAEVAENYPCIIQLGDVTKWYEWDIDWSSIDLVIGGSPCQGFSFAGKQLAFDDPRSALFFEYVNILEWVKLHNPNVYYMLENVKMKRESLDVITEFMNVEPVFINSALVCAQNRQRYYWCNWYVPQPREREIYLSDILEKVVDSKYYHTSKALEYMNRTVKGGRTHFEFGHHSDTGFSKSSCITANMFKGVPYNLLIDRDKTRCISSSIGRTTPREYYKKNQGHLAVYTFNDEDPHLCRKLTVVECCRLQGVPDDYFKVSSNTQAYKMLGNGWQCDTIEHIFSYCPLLC